MCVCVCDFKKIPRYLCLEHTSTHHFTPTERMKPKFCYFIHICAFISSSFILLLWCVCCFCVFFLFFCTSTSSFCLFRLRFHRTQLNTPYISVCMCGAYFSLSVIHGMYWHESQMQVKTGWSPITPFKCSRHATVETVSLRAFTRYVPIHLTRLSHSI